MAQKQDSEATLNNVELADQTVQIVIIGASLGGMATLRQLESRFGVGKAHILVIEKNQDFMFHDVAPRSMVEGRGWAGNALWSYGGLDPDQKDEISKSSSISSVQKITATVLELHLNYLVLHNQKRITFDYVVVATGSHASPSNPFVPIGVKTRAQGMNYFNKAASSIKSAQSICLVGGGPSSCELAAEIKLTYPEKSVCIIHSRSRLLSSNDVYEYTKKRLESKLERLGVRLILGDRVSSSAIPTDSPYRQGLHIIKTEKGVEINSELTFFCISKPNPSTAFLRPTYPSILDKSGFILVKDTLQINHDESSNMFAMGDVAATGAPKMTRVLNDQATIVAANIYNLSTSKNKDKQIKLKKYKAPKDDLIGVPLGRIRGVVQLPFIPEFAVPVVMPIIDASIGFIKNNSVYTYIFKTVFGYST